MADNRMYETFKKIDSLPDDIGCSVTAGIVSVRYTPADFSQFDSPYTDIRVSDGDELRNIRIWGFESDKPCEVVEGAILRLNLRTNIKNGRMYYRLTSVSKIEITEELRRRFFFNKYRSLTRENRAFFVASLDKIQDKRYCRYVQAAYGLGSTPPGVSDLAYKAIFDVMATAWCSIANHDAYPGGYVNHIVGCVRLVDAIRGVYGMYPFQGAVGRIERGSEVNWDLVYTLVYLHDIGKPETYEPLQGEIAFRKDQVLQHNYQGMLAVERIHNLIEEHNQLPRREYQELLHGIMVHDGMSMADAMSPEERILKYVDGLEACMVNTLKN